MSLNSVLCLIYFCNVSLYYIILYLSLGACIFSLSRVRVFSFAQLFFTYFMLCKWHTVKNIVLKRAIGTFINKFWREQSVFLKTSSEENNLYFRIQVLKRTYFIIITLLRINLKLMFSKFISFFLYIFSIYFLSIN